MTIPGNIDLPPGGSSTVSASFGPVELEGQAWLISEPWHPYITSPGASIIDLSAASDNQLQIELEVWHDAPVDETYDISIFAVSLEHGVIAEGTVEVTIADDGP